MGGVVNFFEGEHGKSFRLEIDGEITLCYSIGYGIRLIEMQRGRWIRKKNVPFRILEDKNRF